LMGLLPPSPSWGSSHKPFGHLATHKSSSLTEGQQKFHLHTTGFHPKSIERYMGSRIGLHQRAIRLLTKFRSWDRLDQCFRKLTLAVFTTVKETKSRLCRHMPIPLSVMGLGRDRSFDKRDPISQSKRSPPKGVGGGATGGGEGVCQGSVQKFFPSLSAKS
jgi:hypothetical protein